MRAIATFAACLLAAGVQAAPIGYEGARHLLDRAGFGADDREIRAYAGLDREQAVERLLDGARTEAATAPPSFVNSAITPPRMVKAMSPEERKDYQRTLVRDGLELRAWWLGEMLATPSPLTERMTLFWHNHFATSQQKVKAGQLMYRQNVLLRSQALGNFALLLHQVAKDPAMLVYLDNARSRREAPNENFAREVMELFTLGVGHYSETDVKEAARAFTGWSLEPETGAYRYRPFFHDAGEKTVLGVRGTLDGDQVLDILLSRPETSRFVATKLWREFVSPTPDPAEVEHWAAVFRSSRYEVKPLLREIFRSNAFWSSANRASLVKSPVDLVVGTLRMLDIQPTDMRPAAIACGALGQNLFSPPNVKGWPGGDAWIDSATLLGRKQYVERLFRESSPMMRTALQPDSDDMREVSAANDMSSTRANAPEQGPEARLGRLLERGMDSYAFDPSRWSAKLARPEEVDHLMLATASVDQIPVYLAGPPRVHALASDPSFQLR